MTNNLRAISQDWMQKFMETWTACALAMVQGDLTVFTVKHAVTAGKTGLAAATAIVVTKYLAKIDNRFMVAWLTGVMTMCADIVVHPTHFGAHWHEAAITGVGAAFLALMLSGALYRR